MWFNYEGIRMETRANFVLIGAFTVLSLVLAAIFTVWIANTGFDQKYGTYDVSFRGPVRGLELGSEVRFNGIKVGEVTNLSLDKSNTKNVLARIRVTEETPIKIDSVAQLEPSGITGMSYIQILAGGENSPPLTRKRGQERPLIYSRPGQLDRFLESGEGVIDNALETVARVNRLLSDQNLKSLAETMNNLERATSKVADNGQLLDNANQAAKTINEASAQIKILATQLHTVPEMAGTYNQLGKDLTVKSGVILDNSNELLLHLSELSKTTNKTMGHANSTLSEIDSGAKSLRKSTENLGSAINNLDAATVSVNQFFTYGTYRTMPDISAAAQQVKTTTENFDRSMLDAGNSPAGLLSRSPDATVKWKK